MQTSERNGPAGAPAEDGFAAEHISQRYGRKTVLHDCTVRAGRGECVGVAGRNGCGKSTLLSVLAGISRPVSGSVTCFGRNLLAGRKAFAELVGYVPQTNPLLEDLSVWDNLRLLSGRNIPKDDRFLKALELTDLLGTKVSALSGGMKRRAAIACSLAVSPPVLVMDEPTSALDLYHKSVIYDTLDSYRRSGGIIIMATHDIREMTYCNRLYLINHGSASETDPESAIKIIKGGSS